MAKDREVGGIRCHAVLARLSDYIDGELGDAERAQVESHLRGCDWCARFGGNVADVVTRLRQDLGVAEPLGEDAAQRLEERLLRELGD